MRDTTADQLWQQYLEAEQVRVRQTMMLVLDRFIDRLLRERPEEWHEWALQLARQVADEGKDIPVRLPLFRRVLLPALVDAVKQGQRDAARWLQRFDIQLAASLTPQHLNSEVGDLLRNALTIALWDPITRQGLKSALRLPEIEDPRFRALREAIQHHKRTGGYYTIDLVSIGAMRAGGYSQSDILDRVILCWDDYEGEVWAMENSDRWPRMPWDDTWLSYEVSAEAAQRAALEALIGGTAVGHTVDTISPRLAERYFQEFVSLFQANRRFYTRLGIGRHEYVFQQGVLVTDQQSAGILWVVEDD